MRLEQYFENRGTQGCINHRDRLIGNNDTRAQDHGSRYHHPLTLSPPGQGMLPQDTGAGIEERLKELERRLERIRSEADARRSIAPDATREQVEQEKLEAALEFLVQIIQQG